MSEHLRPHHEQHRHRNAESHQSHEAPKPDTEKIKAAEAYQQEVLQEMERLTDTFAVSSEDIKVDVKGESQNQHTPTFGAYKQLKLDSYKKTLSRVQSHLKGPEKSFSKVVHARPIEKVSNAGARTVARPLGLLTAGLFAFVGSAILLYTSRHYGFTYNFSFFVLLFCSGYLVGLVLEAIRRIVRR